MIVIIDYGMGNLGSIQNMIKHIGGRAIISSKAEDLRNANKLILPGVGAFDHGMQNLERLGLVSLLNQEVVDKRKPILGICLGMQLLTRRSEEGKLQGLGWIDGETVRFQLGKESRLKVPHMGWNEVVITQKHTLFNDLEKDARFYFVHSYHVVCSDEKNILSETSHGNNFVSSVIKENILGTQFHPEKSHRFGMKLLKNFLEAT
jgi:imidazole glycerol-phosphate synthase subunit HisH